MAVLLVPETGKLLGVLAEAGRAFAAEAGRAFAAVAVAACAVGSAFRSFADAVAHAVEAEERRAREYLLSDRYQLDLIERQHHHDPIAWSEAVGEFFTRRAHRELASLVGPSGTEATYGHLSLLGPLVSGEEVTAGTVIGHVGVSSRGHGSSHIIIDEARRLS